MMLDRSMLLFFPVPGVLDNIELGLELLSVYNLWDWTLRQLDELCLPMIARLTASSCSQPSACDDSDVTAARLMLGIIGT